MYIFNRRLGSHWKVACVYLNPAFSVSDLLPVGRGLLHGARLSYLSCFSFGRVPTRGKAVTPWPLPVITSNQLITNQYRGICNRLCYSFHMFNFLLLRVRLTSGYFQLGLGLGEFIFLFLTHLHLLAKLMIYSDLFVLVSVKTEDNRCLDIKWTILSN